MKTTILRRLVRFETVAAEIRRGLNGTPFLWPEWARKLYMPVAWQLGCTLLPVTTLEKRGYRLKRGARPVGKVYFGAPLSMWVLVYLVEVQATRQNEKAERRGN